MTSPAAKGVCLLLVLSLGAVAVLAVAPCDDNIIYNLGANDCYGGLVPKQWKLGQRRATLIWSSKADLPANTRCATATFQVGPDSVDTYTHFLLHDSRQIDSTFVHETNNTHIIETDKNGAQFKLYVIHNENNVYTYYRCTSDGAPGNGHHQVATYVGCNYVTRSGAEFYYGEAQKCFNKLGIKDVQKFDHPCVCNDFGQG